MSTFVPKLWKILKWRCESKTRSCVKQSQLARRYEAVKGKGSSTYQIHRYLLSDTRMKDQIVPKKLNSE